MFLADIPLSVLCADPKALRKTTPVLIIARTIMRGKHKYGIAWHVDLLSFFMV